MLIKNTCVNCKGPKIKPSQAKSCTGIDTNQLIYVANQLTGFYTYLIREWEMLVFQNILRTY